MNTQARGRFITFEGIDGAGKSSHLDWFADRLRAHGIDCLQTREPGGTPLGERLRELVLHEPMQPATEALLIFAARQEHLLERIEPALAAGRWVLCDRFTDATFAYQGYGRGFDLQRLAELEHWVQGELRPDATVIFDCPPQLAAERLGRARAADRFEREGLAFFERVARGYAERAAATHSGTRYFRIDSSQDLQGVRAVLQQHVIDILLRNGPSPNEYGGSAS